jgi:dihydrofolate reductase
MKTKFSVFIATSLDGFVARKDGSLDWLPGSDGAPSAEDTGYEDFYASVDTLVMGRNTYDLVQSFGEWPYPGKRVVVLSSHYPKSMQPVAADVWGVSATPAEMAVQLESLGTKHVYVDGGKTIQRFLRAGLIDEMTITHIPVLLGEGIPLFGALDRDILLSHCSTRTFNNGMVQSRYRVSR